MSDKIDLELSGEGDGSIDRLTSAVERLEAAMTRLGENDAVTTLARQMEMMQAVMVTGFANLAATSEKILEGLGTSQVRAIEGSAEKTVAAIEAAGLKMKAADARTWQQIQAGSASNVTAAFNQLAQGIPVEAVETRFGKMAAATAASLDGQLVMLRQFQENTKSLYATDYKPMAGATEAQLQEAAAMNMRFDAQVAAARQALVEKRDLEEYALRSASMARLQALVEKRDMEEYTSAQAAAQRILDIEQRRDIEQYTARSAAAARMAEIQQRRDMEEFTAAQAAAQRIIEIEQKRDLELHNMRTAAAADAQTQMERQRALNTSYLTSSPQSQVRTATQAQVYAGLGGDAEARYGSAAAGANALAAAQARLVASAAEAGTAQLELGGALSQVEGAFRGAAHQAGLYGLHHGQLIALLAGGALAAGLHHIAETGAEVEFQLSSLNALGEHFEPIDMDKFIGITAGSLTNLKDAAEGMHALAQAGQDQGAAMAALPDVMRLASLGEMTVGQAAEMSVESMHAFGKSITDLGSIGDVLVAVGAKSNVSVHKLAEDMKSAAVTGELFNLSMQEITATVGVLAERGLTIQPLSSALNKLYEPSAKTAKVMAEMGLSTKTASGELKNYTQFVGELAAKVNEYKEPADPLKMLGMSTQSIKAMEVMTQHTGDYLHLLEEADHASGKMFEATLVKADTVTGAYEMLGSTVQGSMVKAFENASPLIRAVEEDLMAIAGSQSTIDFLTAMASGFARLTQDIIENRDVIGLAIGAYVGLRVASTALDLIITTTAAWTGATVGATTAVTAQGVAATTTGAQLDLFAVGEGVAAAGAVELGVGAGTAAVGLEGVALALRGVIASLGPIGLALAAVTIGMDLFAGAQSKADNETQKALNSGESSIAMYEKELQRLKDLEEQLNRTGKAGADAANEIAVANLQMEKTTIEAQVSKLRAEAGPARVAGADGLDAPLIAPVSDLDKALDRLKQVNVELGKRKELQTQVEEHRENVEAKQSAVGLRKKISDIPMEIVAPQGATKAMQDAAAAATVLRMELGATAISAKNLDEVTQKEKELESLIAASRKPGPGPTTTGNNTDEIRARIEALQEQLRIAKEVEKTQLADLASENKRGELGDLKLINDQLAVKLTYDKQAVDVARQQLDIARQSTGKHTASAIQKAQNNLTSAEQLSATDNAAAERARLDLFDRMDGQELAARAKTLQSRGQLEDAYNLTWEAKNASLMSNLNSDIAAAEGTQYEERLERYKAFLLEQRRLGANDARFKERTNDFDNTETALQTRLAALKAQRGPGTGLASLVNNSFDTQDTYADMLPKLQAAQARVAAAASPIMGGDDNKLKVAQQELNKIQVQMAEMRNGFVELGDTIAKSLTDAFGKGGTALGVMITTATSYDAKMREIQTTLASSDGGAAAQQKAADDTASAQIKAYGSMAGAAKGFFDTNSSGYKVLGAAEKAFRVVELAESLSAMVKKIGFKTTEVAAVVGLNATKVGAETAATGASVANAGTEASAWGVTAVAKAIASMPFPLNLAAGAATMAAIVALGVKLTGGGFGSGASAADRQAENGTGTVLGDPKAKSDSIAKSLAAVEKNTFSDLTVSQGMLAALQSIESNISSFSALLVQNTGISNPDVNLKAGAGSTAIAKLDMTATGAELGSLFGPVGTAVGAVVGLLASKVPVLQHLYTSIFGGKQSLDDSGFTMDSTTLGGIASSGVNAQTYADVTTSGGWFRSDKHSTNTSGLGTDADNAISQVITSIGDTIKIAGGILGLSGDAFNTKLNSFVIDIGKISLKGLSTSEQQAAIQATFSKLGDQMASFAVSTIGQFSKAGEGALETLTRVANEYQTVDAVFAAYGTTFGQVGVASIAARENLIDLAGGLDKFTSQAEFLIKNLMSPAQQLAVAHQQVDPTLAKYGLSTVGPDANQKFADVVIALGKMGSAGAQAYTELMNIAPAFKTITDAAADMQDQINDLLMTQAEKDAAARAKLDPANQALFDQLQDAKDISGAKDLLAQAYENESQAMQTAIDKLKTFSLSLHTFVTSLTLGTLSPLNPADKYAAAKSQFETTLAAAKGGDATAQSNLQSAAQAFLQASQAANASNSTYQSDYQHVISASDSLAHLVDGQITDAQQQLNVLHDQVNKLVDINKSVLTVADAINNLAIIQSHGQDTAINTTALSTLYQEIFHRTPDAAGLDFWNQKLKDGVSLSDIIDAMQHSAEALGVPASNSTIPSSSINNGTAPVKAGAGTGSGLAGNPNTNAAAGASAQITAMYQQYLNRAPDAAGLAFWVKQAQSGVSLTDIAAAIKNSGDVAPTSMVASSKSSASVSADPYVAINNANAALASQMAVVSAQIAGLRTDQQVQADQQVNATMAAGAGTAAEVSDALKTSTQAAAWASKNTMALR